MSDTDTLSHRDLSLFTEVPTGKKRLPWEKRMALIESQFPNARDRDWKAAFDEHLELFAWMMQDILKADQAAPGRDGPKPKLDMVKALPRFRQMMHDDYSMRPFLQSFADLCAGLSLSQVAAKTGLSRSQVNRLLKGEIDPTAWDMETIARGFRKQPGYFVEYRNGVVMAALHQRMLEIPESSVKYYMQLVA